MSKKCLYCGNNPVAHRMQWVNQSLIVLITPLNIFLAQSGFVKLLGSFFDRFFAGLWWLFMKCGLAEFESDRTKTHIERAQVLWEEAERRGIKMESARLFGREVDFYHAVINGQE